MAVDGGNGMERAFAGSLTQACDPWPPWRLSRLGFRPASDPKRVKELR
jgi:hypothetical protein